MNSASSLNTIDYQHESQEFLTFTLGTEHYGIDILKVQEIRAYERVTKIAKAPPFIKGVINLRGSIVPIIDLRIKFNLSNIEYDAFTVVIILNIAGRIVGIVVDSVSDVVNLDKEQIREAPEFSSSVLDTRYILGLGSLEENMIILIAVDDLILSDNMELADKTFE